MSAPANAPRLSIIVATRDRADSLTRLLDSISVACGKIDAGNVELIVADNGSADHTREVVASFKRDSGLEVGTVREDAPGKARALNRALEVARGEICAFVDDDIIVTESWIETVLAVFSNQPEIDVAGGRVEPFDREAASDALRTADHRFRVTLETFTPRNIPIIGCNVAYRRALLKKKGGFDPDIGPGSYIGSGDDLDMLYRALQSNAVVEYRPDITVLHDHGRMTEAQIAKVRKRYVRGRGAFYHKYGSNNHKQVRRWAYWEARSLLSALISRPWSWGAAREGLSSLAALASGVLASTRVRGIKAELKVPLI